MVSKKPAPKHPGGRPPKGGEAATRKVTLSLTTADSALLNAIQAQEQERMDRLRVPMQVSPADALRIVLRDEAERRGIGQEAPPALSVQPPGQAPSFPLPQPRGKGTGVRTVGQALGLPGSR